MTSRDCPRTLVCSLELRREDRQLEGTLVLAFDDQAYSVAELAREILGGRQGVYFSRLHHEVRRKSYLLARYAAKLALSELLVEKDLQAIEVVRGVFEQPIVQYNENRGYSVTISHAGSVAGRVGVSRGAPDAHRY